MLSRWLVADPSPRPSLASLHRTTTVATPVDETFACFADAANLVRLTPPWLRFPIVTACRSGCAKGRSSTA